MSQMLTKTRVRQGRIVIPAKIREALDIREGEVLTMDIQDNELRVRTSREALRRLQALVRKHVPEGVSLVDELIRDRREEARREERGE